MPLRAPLNSRGARTWGVRRYSKIQPQTRVYRLFGRACIVCAPDLEGHREVWKFQTSAVILVWRFHWGWTRRFHWDRTQSMITLLNHTQGLKIIENTVIFFLSELLGEVSNFEGGSTLYRSSTTKNLRALSLIFTESQSKQFCSYLWTSDICVSVH